MASTPPPPPLMSHVEYAELLVGKALENSGCSKAARQARKAALVAALCALQAAIIGGAATGDHSPE